VLFSTIPFAGCQPACHRVPTGTCAVTRMTVPCSRFGAITSNARKISVRSLSSFSLTGVSNITKTYGRTANPFGKIVREGEPAGLQALLKKIIQPRFKERRPSRIQLDHHVGVCVSTDDLVAPIDEAGGTDHALMPKSTTAISYYTSQAIRFFQQAAHRDAHRLIRIQAGLPAKICELSDLKMARGWSPGQAFLVPSIGCARSVTASLPNDPRDINGPLSPSKFQD